MIADLKSDSARWEQEVERRANMGYSRGTYVQDVRRSRSPNELSGSYVSPAHELRSQSGPSPPTFSVAPTQYIDPYAQQQQQQPQFGAPQGQYTAPSYSTSQSPGYGQNPYATPPQQNTYSGPSQGQPPISAPDVHQPSYTYSSNPPGYGYEGRNAAPRYPGAGYDNEPDYSPVTSGMGYPAATAPADARIGMDPRYTPEAPYPEHRAGANRPQQNRDPHRRAR